MSLKRSLVVAAAFLVGVVPAGAQDARKLDVSFNNGRVTIVAENVTLQEIFAEWSRKGGSRIFNAERLPAARVMLTEFKDLPEADVLRTLLREAPGYGAALRNETPAGSSTIQTVVIMAVRTIAPTATNAPAVNQPQIQTPPPQAQPRMLQGSPDDEIPPVRPIAGNQPPMTPGGAPASQPSNPNLRTGPGGIVTSTIPGVPIPAPTPAPGTPPAGRGRGGGGGSR